jgi:peptidyl-prolyl cis-trans isomerase B (cyclophilin B)
VPSNKQRREASRRQLQRQIERRQLQEQRRRRTALIASIIGTIAVVGIVVGFIVATSGEDKKPAAASTTPSSSAASTTPTPSRTPGVCPFTQAGTAARKVTAPGNHAPTTGTATVAVTTNLGKMTFKLNRAAAPCTVESFVSLVKQKYFNNTTCHRLVTSGIYVLQCGDPTATGTGGPGYSVPDEATGSEQYPAGTIAMARTSSPNSGGSQFFIVYKDSPALQQQLGAQQYTVFGTVTSGMNVVNEVAAKGSDNSSGAGDGKPKLKIELEQLTAS